MLLAHFATGLGTIPGWLTLIAVVALGWTVSRGAGGQALGIERQANEVLRTRVAELVAENTELKRTRTLEPLIEQLSNADERAQQRSINHEQRANERHAAMLRVLEMIAERLGEEPNGESS